MVRISGTGSATAIGKSSSGKGKKAASNKSSRNDNVQVSDAAGLRERAKVMLADMPDVRIDKIEGIRATIEQGNYEVDSKTVSAFIVRNALSEHSWG